MNWGHKITLAYVGFIAFILFLVVKAFGEDVDLVTKDYYAQEIAYQERMVQKANAYHAEEKATVKQLGLEIIVNIPEGFTASGEIHFYHPSKVLFDRKFDLAMDTQNEQRIDRSQLIPGHYRINLMWEVDGKEYFQQEKLYIQ